MHHLYLSYQPSEASLRKEREALEGWCREGGINDHKILEEKRKHPTKYIFQFD